MNRAAGRAAVADGNEKRKKVSPYFRLNRNSELEEKEAESAIGWSFVTKNTHFR